MVVAIPTSDSNTTLVSLDPHQQQDYCGGYQEEEELDQQQPPPLLVPTNLILLSNSNNKQQQCCLYLPPKNRCSPSELDQYLLQQEEVFPWTTTNNTNIYDKPIFQFTPATKERVLYIHQGEIAHATSSQCDIMMSDRATTCHIMIVHSTSTKKSTTMTSLTHIDGTHTPGYSQSIKELFAAHKIHHHQNTNSVDDDENDEIQMTIHILGGFNTPSSHELSFWLLYLLAEIATEAEEATAESSSERRVRMILETCCISSLNDTGHGIPKGRGFGINLHTGNVFLAKAQAQTHHQQQLNNATTTTTIIPVLPLRNARIWALGPKRLHLIHTTTSNHITLYPFVYKTDNNNNSRQRHRHNSRRRSSSSSYHHHYYNNLLKLSDQQLLQQTSTSPHVENITEFVSLIRSTLQLLRDVPPQQLFGYDLNQPIKFERCVGTLHNHWSLV